MADNIINYQININGNATANLNQINKVFKKVSDSAGNSTGKLERFGNTALMLNALTSTVQNISSAFQTLVGPSLEVEQRQVSLVTLFNGNAKAASDLTKQIKSTAAANVYGAGTMLESQKQMMAFGISSDKAFKSLTDIGDIALGDKNKMSSLSLAFAQCTSTGKLMGQDLLQMINAGFNPLEEISRKTGKSIGELKDEMSRGAISADMVAQAFHSATEEGGKFYKGAENASHTTAAKIAAVKNKIDEMKVSLFNATGGATAYVAEIGSLVTPVAQLLPLIKGLGSSFMWLGGKWGGFIKSFKSGIIGLIMNLQITSFSAIYTGGAFKVMEAAGKSACRGISTAIKSIPIVGWIAAAIAAVITVVTLLWQKCEGFRELVMGIWEVIKAVFSGLWDMVVQNVTGIYEIFASLGNSIGEVFSSIGGFFISVWNTVSGAVSSFFNWIGAKLGSVGQWIKNKIITPVSDFFSNTWNFIKGMLDSIIQRIGRIFNPIIQLWNKLTGKVVSTYNKGAAKGKESWENDNKGSRTGSTGGIKPARIPGVNSGGMSRGGSKPSAKTTQTAQAAVTGGTRSSTVNIRIDDMIKQVIFNGNTSENREEIQRTFAETLNRVLGMAQTA